MSQEDPAYGLTLARAIVHHPNFTEPATELMMRAPEGKPYCGLIVYLTGRERVLPALLCGRRAPPMDWPL